ncbi:MAG: hypothetical protein LBQ10_09785 [Desulfovibrio sp.]|nr:hypothetical protein [Desulfovibrio sp.]
MKMLETLLVTIFAAAFILWALVVPLAWLFNEAASGLADLAEFCETVIVRLRSFFQNPEPPDSTPPPLPRSGTAPPRS